MRRYASKMYIYAKGKTTSGEYLFPAIHFGKTFQVFYRFPFNIMCARILFLFFDSVHLSVKRLQVLLVYLGQSEQIYRRISTVFHIN